MLPYVTFSRSDVFHTLMLMWQVEVGSSGIFIGVHDGHCGSEAAEFLRHSLYDNLASECHAGTATHLSVHFPFLKE